MRAKLLARILSASLVLSTTALIPVRAIASSFDEEGEQLSIEWIGQRRADKGRDPVVVDPRLSSVARNHAMRMRDRHEIYHNRNLMNETSGYSVMGENVGGGFSVPDVNDSFWDSDGHRHNILNEWTHMGIGIVWANGEVFIVQVFGQKSSSSQSSSQTTKAKEKKAKEKKAKKSSKAKDNQTARKPDESQTPQPQGSPSREPDPQPSGPPPEPSPSPASNGSSQGNKVSPAPKADRYLVNSRRPLMTA